jgi:hypothetical protein
VKIKLEKLLLLCYCCDSGSKTVIAVAVKFSGMECGTLDETGAKVIF